MTQQRIQFFSTVFTLLLAALPLKAQSPIINAQPHSQTVIAGSGASFVVSASGAGEATLPSVSSGTLQLWLKADAGVITTNGHVAEWQDQSANANHAFQPEAAKQPLLIEGAVPISGLPVVRFDGIQTTSSGDFLQGSNDVAIPSGYTSFLVYSRANRVVEEQAIAVVGIPYSYDSIRSYFIRSISTENEMAFSGWGNDYGTGFSIPANTFRIWTDRMNETKSQLEFFDTDGSNSFTNAQGAHSLNAPGVGYYLGGLGDYTRNFQGDVAELIFYQGSLTESDRIAVENYLKLKYYQASTPGGGTLTYQWRFNGTNLDGATTTSLTLTNVQATNAGNYSVIVSNNFGGTETEEAHLTVDVPPSITAQPQNQAVLSGTNAEFSVAATGTLPLSYQWFFNGAAIPFATNSSYTINSALPTNAGNYSVTATNVAGLISSSPAVLSIPVPPAVSSQPEGQIVMAGTNVTLSVAAETILPNVFSGSLRLWLEADQGTVIENGQVKEWRDQSTNGNHAFQSNTNKQPLFIDSVASISGKPTVRFDGIQNINTGDWMRGTNDVGIPAGYTSFLIYLRANRTIAEQALSVFGIPSQSSALRSYFIRNSGEMAFSAWNNDYGTGYNLPADNYRIWTDRLNDAKTSLEFFDVTATNTSTFTRNTSGLGTPGPGYYLGGLDGYVRNFQGDISELLVYQGALTDPDRLAVQNYLKAKYYFGLGNNALNYQWQLDGTNLPGATNSTLYLTNVSPVQSGNYTVALTNLAGSITSAPALVKIGYLFPAGNGQRLTNDQYSYVSSANLSFQKFFANGMIFYTLDGSTPTFASKSYNGPFALTKSATLRAIVYSSDFSQSGESFPVNIEIIPTYSLSSVTAGGGSISINGTGPFLTGSVVSVTATADDGWTFLHWLEDATGTNSTTDVTMTRNKSVRAVFGTSLNTTATGNGAVSIYPANSLYPYGSVARLTATPQSGNYFGIWGNAASGNVNPLYFTVTNANRTVSSLFSPLSGGQFSLALSATGSGRTSASPRANAYNSGQLVTLTAIPDAEQSFISWSGDASGSSNPLSVTMNQSRFVTANFTKNPRLSAQAQSSTFALEGLQLFLSGEPGEIYSLQKSTNLTNWLTIGMVTNSYGTIQINDLPSTNSSEQFYRAAQP